MGTEYKRSRLWIDPPLQLRLLLRLVLYFLVYSVTLFHVAFLYEVMANLPDALARGMWALYGEFFSRQQPFLIACVAVLPILLYDMVKFSHRIAGPLYRCRKTMEAMTRGKAVAEFQPRQHDLLRDLIAAFNALIRKWNASHGAGVMNPDNEDSSAETLQEQSALPTPASSSAVS